MQRQYIKKRIFISLQAIKKLRKNRAKNERKKKKMYEKEKKV